MESLCYKAEINTTLENQLYTNKIKKKKKKGQNESAPKPSNELSA